MKIIDVYNNYKLKYKNYVVIIKSGIFYDVLNDDTSILFFLLNYKIKNNGNNFIIGFPSNSLSRVCSTLESYKISYVVIDKDRDGNFIEVDNFKPVKNKYLDFYMETSKINYISYRIDNINEKLKSKMRDKNIDKILDSIEDLI